ncbi:Hypothetical protein SMAX5B_004760 [Scophthalmus maximus]|uniref:Uncharacterized protein n=1 Tax=Scophthalmus maximus TaxID=52904 RepID=A0A2U9CAI9_SCOMX|nr:Hypothetical protein SMAX5B_004760 [Scophthalmus maximus]
MNSKPRGGAYGVSQALNGGEAPPRHQQASPSSMAHDAVLVLDPSPGENFGHPVVLFYVDVNVTKKRCSQLDGIYLGDECLTLALKGRCQNQLKRRLAGPERLMGNGHGRLAVGALRGGTIGTGGGGGGSGGRLVERAVGGLCEVHFLPLVVGVGDGNRTQRLRCVGESYLKYLHRGKDSDEVDQLLRHQKIKNRCRSLRIFPDVLAIHPGLVKTRHFSFNTTNVIGGDECLTLALKGRCQNQLKRRLAGPERLMGNGHGRLAVGALRGGTIGTGGGGGGSGGRLVERAVGGLCEVHFLPLVVGVGDGNRTQRLRCVDHAEFARCPQPLPMASASLPVSSCELNKNTRRCHQQPLATHLSCRLYQTCDHAVLISGGWQQQMTFQRHVQNLQRFYRMLRNNGLHKDHIKTFFAGSGQLPEDVEGVYSATEKAVIRNHVSYVCRKQHCADTLVLYLNSPTRNDGTMLLWDANINGIADLKERYSVNELLADLAGCRATRVLLFVDQSYSGVLSKRLRGSQKHLNVVLIQRQTHSQQNQRSGPGSEDGGWSSISPAICLLDHLGKGAGVSRLLEPWAGLLNVTLAGAPCNATPPLTDGEMRREYQGCQNLPTALWHQKHRRTN